MKLHHFTWKYSHLIAVEVNEMLIFRLLSLALSPTQHLSGCLSEKGFGLFHPELLKDWSYMFLLVHSVLHHNMIIKIQKKRSIILFSLRLCYSVFEAV